MTDKAVLPDDPKERKALPVASGVLDYFPAALIEIAKVSKAGNDQHNPGQPLHWARGKSNDHADAMQRHFIERGTFDTDGLRHSAKMAWRALAILQEELEAAGAPLARGAIVAQSGTPQDPPEYPYLLSGDALWEWRTNTHNQGELYVHAIGVCKRCDSTYPESSRLHSGDWYKLLPLHVAE